MIDTSWATRKGVELSCQDTKLLATPGHNVVDVMVGSLAAVPGLDEGKPDMYSTETSSRRGLLALVGPGLLVAATGVGAGDLATAGLVGSNLGTAILWAVVLGAVAKLVLNENLARWQIATGQTILEGAVTRLGWFVFAPFAVYFLAWTYFVGSALISACGVTLQALVPLTDDPELNKRVLGAGCSLIGLILVWFGGFRLFEKVMAVCVGIMVVVTVLTAAALAPALGEIVSGLFVPRIPDAPGAVAQTVALIGGVGGTLTIICYSYWMREAGRVDANDLGTARLDIAVGYAMTALFGIAMVVIAAGIEVTGGGAGLVVQLADRLDEALVPALGETLASAARFAFLVGAFGAVFSSLLGVWQAVPYVATDLWQLRGHVGKPEGVSASTVSARSRPYRIYLLAIAIIPMAGLYTSFSTVQLAYAFVGALFVPALGLVLLVLNNSERWIGRTFRNRWLSNSGLVIAIVVVGLAAAFSIQQRLLQLMQ